MKDLINILLLEDNPNDAILAHNQVLKSGIKFKWLHVAEWDGFVDAIQSFKPDLILSDYNLGSFTGLDALEFVKKNYPLIPFIIVTGSLNEEIAANTIKLGAWDYVVKERLTRLNTAVIAALKVSEERKERNKAEEELQQSNNFNNYLLKTIPFGMDIVDESGTVLFQSDNWKELVGANGVGKKCWEMYRDDKTQCSTCPLNKGIKIGETDVYESHNVLGGKIFEVNHTGMMFNGKKAMLEIFINITERKQMEETLIASEKKIRSILENSADAIFMTDENGKYTYTNKKVTAMLGFSQEEMKKKTIIDLSPQNRIPEYLEIFNSLKSEGRVFTEIELLKSDDSYVSTDLNAVVLPDGMIYASCRDITARKLAESELIEKLNELEIFNNASVDREVKINELRKEINELLEEMGKKAKYEIIT